MPPMVCSRWLAAHCSGGEPQVLILIQIIGARDVAAAAVARLLVHPARIMPVLGTNNLSCIAKLDAACAITFDREQWFEVFEAAKGCEVP